MTVAINGTSSCISKFNAASSAALSSTFSGLVLKDFERVYPNTDVTKLYFNTYTVTATTTVDTSSLTDNFGNALSFGTVKHLHVVNNTPSTTLTIGGGTNPLISALPKLIGTTQTSGSSGANVIFNTQIVTSGSIKNILLVASGGTSVTDLVIAGT